MIFSEKEIVLMIHDFSLAQKLNNNHMMESNALVFHSKAYCML